MLTKSLHRHLLHFSIVLILIGVGFYFGSTGKAELKGELNAHEDEIKELRQLVSHIAKQPKVNVQNEIKDVKVKNGSKLSFIPDVEVQQINTTTEVKQPVKAIISTKDQENINKLQNQLNRLKSKGKRRKKQRKLQEEINKLREPP